MIEQGSVVVRIGAKHAASNFRPEASAFLLVLAMRPRGALQIRRLAAVPEYPARGAHMERSRAEWSLDAPLSARKISRTAHPSRAVLLA